MSKDIAMSEDVMNAVAEAFGLSEEVNRVVIDLEAGCTARLIVVEYLTTEQKDALVEALRKLNPEVVGRIPTSQNGISD